MSPIDEGEVHRLFARVREADEAAFTELHRLVARRVFAFAMRRVQDEHLAEDVVVNTMLQVWNSAARFRGESRVCTWILGIARIKALEAMRTREPQHADIDDYADVLVAEGGDGESALERWQVARIVRGCLEELSAVQRECLHLVHYEDLPLADIAAVQGVPENTVKTRLFHARRNMRSCVEREGACT